MTVHGLRMQVAGGSGLVVAGPVAALFVDDDGSDAAGHEFVSALVEAVTAVPDPADDPGPALVRKVGGLVAGVMSRGAAVAPFALVAETGGGVAVMIVGPVAVRYTGAGGASEQLSGRNAATWVDRIFHGTPASVVVSTDSGGATPSHPLADLGHGAVGGGGFELLPPDDVAGSARHGVHAAAEDAQDHRPRPGPVPAEPEPVGEPAAPAEAAPQYRWEPVVAGPADLGPAEVGAVDEPGWTPGWTAAPEPEPESEPESPWSQPVPVAPPAPERQPEPEPEPQPEPEPEPEPEPGPPVLHRPDGSTLEIGRLVVLGREPQISPLVVAGEAEAVTLDDEARVTSRVHASVVADGEVLTVTDLGSANGTWVLHEGDSEWTELTANEPTALRAGGRIRIGSEEFVFGHR